MDCVEVVGYVASGLIVASLAMRSLVRLRVVSLLGSAAFVAYGALLASVPVMIATDAGIRRLVAEASTTEHRTYLESVGVRPEGHRFVKELGDACP